MKYLIKESHDDPFPIILSGPSDMDLAKLFRQWYESTVLETVGRVMEAENKLEWNKKWHDRRKQLAKIYGQESWAHIFVEVLCRERGFSRSRTIQHIVLEPESDW